jgi:ornithine racemase
VIPGLHTDAFQLIAEVIESKRKTSIPLGEICQDAFGNVPDFIELGECQPVIIALVRQDVQLSNMKCNSNLKIIGSSSDHIILDGENHNFKVGDDINFILNYGGLLAIMTSPYAVKQFIESNVHVVA